MREAPIRAHRWHALRVTPKTVWTFVEIVDEDDRVGVGEATLGGQETETRRAVDGYAGWMSGRTPAAADLAQALRGARSLPQFAALSALDQARCDLAAQRSDMSVADWLGTKRRPTVRAYANINRGIEARTPEGFAARARDAVADGFDAIKIAPFDEVTLYGRDEPAGTWRLEPGLARIAAVRLAIGADVALRVDCHWRLNRPAAETVLREVDALKLDWLECPVPETPELLGTIAALRSCANERGVRLAGCEEMSRVDGFMPFLSIGAYDVLMPDVKYAGGMREILAVAEAMRRAGAAFSPHNPSGPIAHAASLHVCAVVEELDRLEVQYAETPWFDRLVNGELTPARGGEFSVPSGEGLGVRLNRDAMQALDEAR